MVNFIYTECRLQNIELKLDELKTIETSILTQDTRRHSLPGKIRLEKRFYVVYLREIYSILALDFTLYLMEIYSILTQDTRRHSPPGKIRLGRDFTCICEKFT